MNEKLSVNLINGINRVTFYEKDNVKIEMAKIAT